MNGNNRAALGANEVHVCIASLDRPESEIRFFESLLAADETQRAKRFYFQKDRERFVVGRGLLRTILSSYLQLPPDEILFAYGAHGKPTVKQKAGQPGIEFNLAHSAGWGIYAITQRSARRSRRRIYPARFPRRKRCGTFFFTARNGIASGAAKGPANRRVL